MTFTEFLIEGTRIYVGQLHPDHGGRLRLGQTYCNLLFRVNRELYYKVVNEMGIDPFYCDDAEFDTMFLTEVGKRWEA